MNELEELLALFGEDDQEDPTPQEAPPVQQEADVPFDAQGFAPYSIPDLKGRPGDAMEGALGTVLALFGGQTGTDPGKYFTPNPRAVIDYSRTGTDTSGDGLPVDRVYNMRGEEIGRKARTSIDSGESVEWRDGFGPGEGEIPGYAGKPVITNPTKLENGSTVLYDPFNNLTYSKSGSLLPGGLGYNGGARAADYGYEVRTGRDGRQYYYDPETNQTFEMAGARTGRQIMDVNGNARYLDGTSVVRPSAPGRVPPGGPPPSKDQLLYRTDQGPITLGPDGAIRQTRGGTQVQLTQKEYEDLVAKQRARDRLNFLESNLPALGDSRAAYPRPSEPGDPQAAIARQFGLTPVSKQSDGTINYKDTNGRAYHITPDGKVVPVKLNE